MATKCIVLGEAIGESKELKPIEFRKVLERNAEWREPTIKPNFFDYIELVQRDSVNGDIMLGYHNNGRNKGCLYLGKWNDGVVE